MLQCLKFFLRVKQETPIEVAQRYMALQTDPPHISKKWINDTISKSQIHNVICWA